MSTITAGALARPQSDARQNAFSRGAALVTSELLDQPRAMLVLRLTLLLMIFHGASSWMLAIPVKVLCGLMLLSPTLMVAQLPWLIIAGAAIVVNAMHWYTIDNHKYLITYWCIVCALAVGTRDPDKVLMTNARALIVLVFGFAVFWKVYAGQYLDGSFMHFTFLQDGRLETPARVIGGLAADTLPGNYRMGSLLRAVPWNESQVTLASSEALRLVTLVASYWTLLIEIAVPLAFLVPAASWLGKWRHALLMVFIGTTYFLLPVLGFAFMLTLLGIAQCGPSMRKTRICYLLLFVFVQMARTPWGTFVDLFTIA